MEHFKQLPGGKSKAWRYFGFRVNGSGIIFNKMHIIKCTKIVK